MFFSYLGQLDWVSGVDMLGNWSRKLVSEHAAFTDPGRVSKRVEQIISDFEQGLFVSSL